MADPGEVKRAADEILSRPEYQPPDTGRIGTALDWIGKRIVDVFEWMGRLFPDTQPSSGVGGGFVIGWILLIVGLAAVAWFLVKVMPRGRLSKRPTAVVDVPRRHHERTSREQWLQRAVDAEQHGDWTQAVRCRYRALVAGLGERRLLDTSEAVTSGEHLRSFEATDAQRTSLAQATDRYERAWYGTMPVGSDDASALALADRRLLAERRRRSDADREPRT